MIISCQSVGDFVQDLSNGVYYWIPLGVFRPIPMNFASPGNKILAMPLLPGSVLDRVVKSVYLTFTPDALRCHVASQRIAGVKEPLVAVCSCCLFRQLTTFAIDITSTVRLRLLLLL